MAAAHDDVPAMAAEGDRMGMDHALDGRRQWRRALASPPLWR